MLTRRRARPDPLAPPRAAWQSPSHIPRRWMTLAFAGSAVFALVMSLVTRYEAHRLWAVFAAGGYSLAALAAAAWRGRRGADAAVLASLSGALIAPLSLLAVKHLQQPEVRVINASAALLMREGTPYPSAQALATAHNPNMFNPYLPVMTAFGLPRALLGPWAATDPRIAFSATFVAVFAAGLAVAGVRDVARWTALVTASPVMAFPLAVGGTDVPVLACLCLGLALLWRRWPGRAGLVLGLAAGMKATAWPALLVAAVLVLARDGKRAASQLLLVAGGVAAAVITPAAAASPRSFAENTIAFPLGLAHVASQAVSPLPGHLLSDTGRAGHLVAVGLLILAGLGVLVSLLVRPPGQVPSATWRLIVGLSLMFVLAPATRFGYLIYPLGMLMWLDIARRGRWAISAASAGGVRAPLPAPLETGQALGWRCPADRHPASRPGHVRPVSRPGQTRDASQHAPRRQARRLRDGCVRAAGQRLRRPE